MNRIDELKGLVPDGRVVVETSTRPPDGYLEKVGLLIMEEGADAMSVLSGWWPFMTPGSWVVVPEPLEGTQLTAAEKRLGRQSVEASLGVFYP